MTHINLHVSFGFCASSCFRNDLHQLIWISSPGCKSDHHQTSVTFIKQNCTSVFLCDRQPPPSYIHYFFLSQSWQIDKGAINYTFPRRHSEKCYYLAVRKWVKASLAKWIVCCATKLSHTKFSGLKFCPSHFPTRMRSRPEKLDTLAAPSATVDDWVLAVVTNVQCEDRSPQTGAL